MESQRILGRVGHHNVGAIQDQRIRREHKGVDSRRISILRVGLADELVGRLNEITAAALMMGGHKVIAVSADQVDAIGVGRYSAQGRIEQPLVGSLLCELMTELRHLFKVRSGSGRNQCLEIFESSAIG